MSITSSRNRRSYVSTIVGLGLLTAIVVVLQYLSMAIRFGAFSVTLALMPIVIGAALYGVWAGAWLGFVFGVIVLASGDAAPFMAINIPGTIITVLLKGILSGFCAGLVYKLIPKGLNFDRNTVTITDILLIAGGIILALVGFLTKPKLEVEQEKALKFFTFCKYFGIIIAVIGICFLVYLLVKKPKMSMSVAVFAAAVVSPIVNTGIFVLGCYLFFFDTLKTWAAGTEFGSNVTGYIFGGLIGMNFFFELAINLILCPAIVLLIRQGERTFRKR